MTVCRMTGSSCPVRSKSSRGEGAVEGGGRKGECEGVCGGVHAVTTVSTLITTHVMKRTMVGLEESLESLVLCTLGLLR